MEELKQYIAEYFFNSQKIVSKYNPDVIVVMQFFQKNNNSILAGMEECLELLNKYLKNTNTIVRYLEDGAKIQALDVVLEIEGNYQNFGIFEGIIDGILSRSTSLATNAYHCVKAANNKEIICMSDRSDHYCNQIRDGKSFLIGGIKSFASWAQSPEHKYTVYGSIPHALIQNLNGDLIKCMKYYEELFPNDELIALVDFNNDVISDSLAVYRHFKHKLKGVRVDTSILNKDKMFNEHENEYGVTPNQIKRLRKVLDDEGGKNVKIFVSSGFDPEKINWFEKENTPVDGYGIGEYLSKINNTFCADLTKLQGQNFAKANRIYRHNPNLKVYKWK